MRGFPCTQANKGFEKHTSGTTNMTMSQLDIRQLFNYSRLPDGWRRLPLLLYAPLGLVLSVIRLFIGLQALLAATVLSPCGPLRSAALRVMAFVLGMVVHCESGSPNPRAKLFLANHVTALDSVALHLLTGCSAMSEPDEPSGVSRSFGFHPGRRVAKQTIQSSVLPIVVFPEGSTTSGNSALLRFSSWPLENDAMIQPVCLRVWRPPPSLNPSVLGSTWWGDLFALLFSPVTVYGFRFLPEVEVPVRSGDSEETSVLDTLAKKIQCDMAQELKIAATSHTDADKKELLKRLTPPQPLSSSTPAPRRSSVPSTPQHQPKLPLELGRLAQQVCEVLPQVSREVVLRDLAVTGSVDLTIANLLEMAQRSSEVDPTPPVTSTTPPTQSTPSQSPSSSPSSHAPTPRLTLDTAANSFGRTACERMASFQERKNRLVANARQRYVEKHGLQAQKE